MLSPEPLDQVEHGGRRPLVLDRGERIAAVLDLAPQLARLVAGVRGAPDRGVADGVGTLPTCPGRVAQDVGPRPVGGDADAEASYLAIGGDGLALLGCR